LWRLTWLGNFYQWGRKKGKFHANILPTHAISFAHQDNGHPGDSQSRRMTYVSRIPRNVHHVVPLMSRWHHVRASEFILRRWESTECFSSHWILTWLVQCDKNRFKSFGKPSRMTWYDYDTLERDMLCDVIAGFVKAWSTFEITCEARNSKLQLNSTTVTSTSNSRNGHEELSQHKPEIVRIVCREGWGIRLGPKRVDWKRVRDCWQQGTSSLVH
jgi:hypothetical protein